MQQPKRKRAPGGGRKPKPEGKRRVKSAKEALEMWALISAKLNGKISSRVEGKKIRVCVDFVDFN